MHYVALQSRDVPMSGHKQRAVGEPTSGDLPFADTSRKERTELFAMLGVGLRSAVSRPSFLAWAMPASTRSRRISRSNSANIGL
jgi:hypothetical protein